MLLYSQIIRFDSEVLTETLYTVLYKYYCFESPKNSKSSSECQLSYLTGTSIEGESTYFFIYSSYYVH